MQLRNSCNANCKGYTTQHLHQRIEEHRYSVIRIKKITKHLKEEHNQKLTNLFSNLPILKKFTTFPSTRSLPSNWPLRVTPLLSQRSHHNSRPVRVTIRVDPCSYNYCRSMGQLIKRIKKTSNRARTRLGLCFPVNKGLLKQTSSKVPSNRWWLGMH